MTVLWHLQNDDILMIEAVVNSECQLIHSQISRRDEEEHYTKARKLRSWNIRLSSLWERRMFTPNLVPWPIQTKSGHSHIIKWWLFDLSEPNSRNAVFESLQMIVILLSLMMKILPSQTLLLWIFRFGKTVEDEPKRSSKKKKKKKKVVLNPQQFSHSWLGLNRNKRKNKHIWISRTLNKNLNGLFDWHFFSRKVPKDRTLGTKITKPNSQNPGTKITKKSQYSGDIVVKESKKNQIP